LKANSNFWCGFREEVGWAGKMVKQLPLVLDWAVKFDCFFLAFLSRLAGVGIYGTLPFLPFDFLLC
jgi:hypothetical protein